MESLEDRLATNTSLDDDNPAWKVLVSFVRLMQKAHTRQVLC